MVLLNKLKHTGHYIKREENNSESQQASRIQSHCGRPGVNSPRQTYVHHCESSNSYPESWPCPPPPTPQNKGENTQSICLPSNSQRRLRVASQGTQMLTLILGYHVLFGNSAGRGEYQNIDPRAVTSRDQRASAGACFHVSVCFLGALSFR